MHFVLVIFISHSCQLWPVTFRGHLHCFRLLCIAVLNIFVCVLCLALHCIPLLWISLFWFACIVAIPGFLHWLSKLSWQCLHSNCLHCNTMLHYWWANLQHGGLTLQSVALLVSIALHCTELCCIAMHWWWGSWVGRKQRQGIRSPSRSAPHRPTKGVCTLGILPSSPS